jgi:four helix bundle protein
MVVRRYQDLIAWQTAEMFRDEIHRLVAASHGANTDLRFRSQILEASRAIPGHIVEGFLRYSPREFMRFLDYAISSLGEAESRLQSGVKANYFSASACAGAFRLARRCFTATIRLKQSQKRFF